MEFLPTLSRDRHGHHQVVQHHHLSRGHSIRFFLTHRHHRSSSSGRLVSDPSFSRGRPLIKYPAYLCNRRSATKKKSSASRSDTSLTFTPASYSASAGAVVPVSGSVTEAVKRKRENAFKICLRKYQTDLTSLSDLTSMLISSQYGQQQGASVIPSTFVVAESISQILDLQIGSTVVKIRSAEAESLIKLKMVACVSRGCIFQFY